MRVSVLTLRLAPPTEPAHHMTMRFLLGSGLPAETPKMQLLICNQPQGCGRERLC
jgi:hypothetical protein